MRNGCAGCSPTGRSTSRCESRARTNGPRRFVRYGLAAALALQGTCLAAVGATPDESALIEQIDALVRDLPPQQTDGETMTQLATRREKAIALIDKLLADNPQTTRRDDMLRARLESMYLVAVVRAHPLDALRSEAQRILADNPSRTLAEYAAYVEMRIDVADHRRKLRRRTLGVDDPNRRTKPSTATASAPTGTRRAASSQVVTTTQMAGAQQRFVVERYAAYIEAYPKSAFAPSLTAAVIRDAWERGDQAVADRYLARLAGDHPHHVETERILAAHRNRQAVGKPFTLTFTSTEGEAVDVRAMKGHVVVVAFWATWSRASRRAMPRLNALAQRLAPRGLRVVGISLDDSREAMDAFVRQHAITWPQHFDGRQWDGEIVRRFAVRSVPATYVVDRAGVLRAIGPKDLDALLTRLLVEDHKRR